MERKTLRVLYVQPGKRPEERIIPNELGQMQQLVEGLIEAVYPPWKESDETVCLVCNDEGKINGSAYNRYIDGFDIIAGSFFICGNGAEDFTSLTDAQMQKYEKVFHDPHLFTKTPSGLHILPCTPEQYAHIMHDREQAKQSRNKPTGKEER